MYEIDEKQIRLWWQTFNPNNKLVEIRLLGKTTFSGYFKNVDKMIDGLRPLLDHNSYQYYGAMQAYFTLNEINDDLYSREQHDVFIKKPKSTTTDGDVVRRRFVLIDLDPSRSAGISASDEEFEKAHLKAVALYRYLLGIGFKEPMITTSGNGYHLYVPCDMPNDESHNELIKRFLQSLGKMFSDNEVEIDEKVFNPARIDKLIGTWAKKGSDTKERKWRIAKIVKVPSDLLPNDDSLFQKVADLLPKEQPKVLPNQQRNLSYNSQLPFDIRTWLNEHGIVYKEEKQGNSTRFTLETCPWVEQHSDHKKWDSALFQDTDGKLTFNCQHSHCKGKTWMDFRLFYEPDAYTKSSYSVPQTHQRQYAQPSKQKYEIKDELPELGEKWLSMSAINKVDISQLEHVKTGFTELDRSIIGLYMSEVTILSGSNASGKSSWLNTLLINIIQQGVKVALWSGELRPDILKAWLQMVAAGKNNLRLSSYGDGKYYVPTNIGERIDMWMDGKFFLYNNEYGAKWQQIFHDMELLLKAGVKVFALDNLFSLDIDILDGDKNNKQRELILQIKDFAKKNQVHIILVAHPRKVITFLRKNDISGSSDLQNAVDKIFIIHRVNNDFFRAGAEFFGQSEIQRFQGYGNVIEVCKERMFGIVDLMIGMHYEIESRRFKNTIDENIKYGWEQEPVQGIIALDNVQVGQSYQRQQEMPLQATQMANTGYQVYNAPSDDLPFGAAIQEDAPF